VKETKMNRHTLSLLCALLACGWGAAAADPLTPTERAEINRDRARYNAESALASPVVIGSDGYAAPETDFVALSMQIERLAAHLREKAEESAMPPAAVPGLELPVPAGGTARHYGPEGPTVKSVTALLEYRLTLAGNPDLKPGRITDEGAAIRAQIVGAEGVVVDEYVIEKASGVWAAVR
jgi:hypothetical protein